MKKFAALTLATAIGLASFASAQAFPVTSPPSVAQPGVVQVDWHGRDHDRWRHRDRWDHDRHRHHGGNVGAVIGGLAAGAIIGGAIANSHAAPSSHVQYCRSKYLSYRASDNTFLSNNGVRLQCR